MWHIKNRISVGIINDSNNINFFVYELFWT